MNSGEHRLRFVGLSVLQGDGEMLSATMSGPVRHRREQKRPAGDRL
jgi:hypothetical protein